MKVNERLTKIARERHDYGIAILNNLFRWSTDVIRLTGLQTGRAKPIRLHPNTPPVRDREHQRKHRLRKISNESRRRNR